MVPSPLPRCASQVLDRGAQANACGDAQVLGHGAQAISRAARSASQVLERGVQAAARGTARCLSHILDRCALYFLVYFTLNWGTLILSSFFGLLRAPGPLNALIFAHLRLIPLFPGSK